MTEHQTLLELTQQCTQALLAIAPKGGRFGAPSDKTKAEYIRTAQMLIHRSAGTNGGLEAAILDTTRPSTYFKRLAALRYYCFASVQDALKTAEIERTVGQSPVNLGPDLAHLLSVIHTVSDVQAKGLSAARTRRKSKRQALRGLPTDWRTQMFQAAARGRYALPMLVCALTGCRPEELTRGVLIGYGYDDARQTNAINIRVEGAKVKATQGQPSRDVLYRADDPHRLVDALRERWRKHGATAMKVQIESSVNFTVEVRRIARKLWPEHHASVTAYCFRHQWAADLKAKHGEQAASRGLGHLSGKTRRLYGTANQASGSQALTPIAVEVNRPVKEFTGLPLSKKALPNEP